MFINVPGHGFVEIIDVDIVVVIIVVVIVIIVVAEEKFLVRCSFKKNLKHSLVIIVDVYIGH